MCVIKIKYCHITLEWEKQRPDPGLSEQNFFFETQERTRLCPKLSEQKNLKVWFGLVWCVCNDMKNIISGIIFLFEAINFFISLSKFVFMLFVLLKLHTVEFHFL